MMNEIEQFNKRFKDNNWLDGNCYYYALILKDRFGGRIIYDPVVGHFLVKIENKCYDYLGCHKLPETYYDWEELKNIDESYYNRIKRDCIL